MKKTYSRVRVHLNADVSEMLQDGFIMLLDHLCQEFDVLEEGQPEARDSLDVRCILITARHQLGVVLIRKTVHQGVVRFGVGWFSRSNDDVAALKFESIIIWW